MQEMNWNDLRYLIALHRQGSFAAAARSMGQDETTIARRVRRLEAALSAQLLQRDAAGRQVLTDLAGQLVQAALRVETETRHMAELADENRGSLKGTVRLTAVPVIVDRVLVPAFEGFATRHPGLTVELIPEGRNLSLISREVDVALRLGPPDAGGADILAQRIGWLEFGLYRPRVDTGPLNWVLYETGHAHLEQARWMQANQDAPASALRLADLSTAIEAVANGLGQSLLPDAACATDPRLRRATALPDVPLPKRPVWMLSHKDQSHLNAIRAVKTWLSQLHWGTPPQR